MADYPEKVQQGSTSDTKESKPEEREATSDTVKNAHASGDGALSKNDELAVQDEKDKSGDNAALRKEAGNY